MSVLINGIYYLLNSPRGQQATVANNQSITTTVVTIPSAVELIH